MHVYAPHDASIVNTTNAELDRRFASRYPATDRQIAFLNSLLAQRDVPATWAAIEAETLDRYTASSMIDAALKFPVRAPRIARADAAEEAGFHKTADVIRANNTPTVPAGRYAIVDTDGVTKFYRVSRPTEGRWAGYTFLDVQASDTHYPIRNAATKAAIMAAIAVDPTAATILYGKTLGVCGVCGRTLTDAESIAAGIGPICAGRR